MNSFVLTVQCEQWNIIIIFEDLYTPIPNPIALSSSGKSFSGGAWEVLKELRSGNESDFVPVGFEELEK